MRRPIQRYGAEVLHRAADPVVGWPPDLRQLIEDMIETMYEERGVGIAAPQVGVPLRVFAIDLSQGKNTCDLVIVVNPELTEREGRQVEEEGCLSVPGFNASVPRPMRAVVRGRDRDGRQCAIEGRGLLARAIQHELDHLEGRLYLDRLRGLHRALLVHRINRRVRKGTW